MAERSLHVSSKIQCLYPKCIDFALAFPQADVKVPIYLHTPLGIQLKSSNEEYETV